MPIVRNNGSPVGNNTFTINSGESVVPDDLWERWSQHLAIADKLKTKQIEVIGPRPAQSGGAQKFLQNIDSNVWTDARFMGVALKHPRREVFILVAARIELLPPNASPRDPPPITTPSVLRRSARARGAKASSDVDNTWLKSVLGAFLGSAPPEDFGAFHDTPIEWPEGTLGMSWNYERNNADREGTEPGFTLSRILASEKGRLHNYLPADGIQPINEQLQGLYGIEGLHDVVSDIGIDGSNFRGGTGFASSEVVAQLPIRFEFTAIVPIPPSSGRYHIELSGTSSVNPLDFRVSLLGHSQYAGLAFDDGEGMPGGSRGEWSVHLDRPIPTPIPQSRVQAVLFWRAEKIQSRWATVAEPPPEIVVGDEAILPSKFPDAVPGDIPLAYQNLAEDLKRFHLDLPFDHSVFVMMKFAEAGMPKWQRDCLDHLYGSVKDELERHGLTARRADQKTYASSKILWENLCIYMLGCKFGVAILEDHIGAELNPNVALEYGFMKGLGREVILLKERAFRHVRADLLGTIPKEFDISDDHSVDRRSVMDGISNWLTDIGIPPRRAR